MGSEDRALRVKARGSRRKAEGRAAVLWDVPAPNEPSAERKRETAEYAHGAMVSSAQAHDRAAQLLERMATAHPEEAESHLQAANRHRRWAENDRKLADEHVPQGDL
ncbi:hypothetical protein [Actinomadura sp. 7K507]|uniref:hypothetical protein n=1 Tax=Actinomadura sp. 7K507 TaxID=2530365 RepID=UPI001051D794|nr:hypothetical protein [Actinomadura sp. 7K507]TDC74562.1 hypothetical protein E1285_43005 [Actinomadura sp. 7K507]